MASTISSIITVRDMETSYSLLAKDMLSREPFDRGEVHAQKTTTPEMVTREIRHLTQYFSVPPSQATWAEITKANLPWAEDHFLERVSGEPLNPPPAEAWWPYAQKGNEAHKKGKKFSHTYPERFWPKWAELKEFAQSHTGIRFEYGDLNDLVEILKNNPRSRQAYLPVWFPEDLSAAKQGERVPCTLGYHFLLNPQGKLDCSYFMRSCDMIRFYRDDVYMAGRLLQWICDQVGTRGHTGEKLVPGELVLHIANLHTFMGDQQFLEGVAQEYDPRKNYNFEGMM